MPGAGATSAFRDLNKNGRLDPYEDPRRPIEERVEDLLAQMTLPEKAGMLFQTMAWLDEEQGSALGRSLTPEMIGTRLMNHFNLIGGADPRRMAEWHNRLQTLAEGSRLGIPLTLSTDPRHSFSDNPAVSMWAGAFSLWPEPIGLAAIGDPALVERFADIARREYLAVGIRLALHPMADLATEPRWGRSNGTFGEDANLAALLVAAYIRGFQGDTLGPESVACMTKHFPGGGPQKDGEDPHFPYGREQIYPGDNFAYHLPPFEAAFAAGTAQIMPYYGMPIGLQYEEVGFGFNKGIITGLLREHYGFEGVVCTDWGLLTEDNIAGHVLPARAWGVEHLSLSERARKALEAGVDQFGGEACPEVVIDLVTSGQISETRIDVSVRRLLRDKFRLGLFDNPYVDPEAAERIVGNQEFRAAGVRAQRQSLVLLKNADTPDGPQALPVRGRPKIYIENINADVAGDYGRVVPTVEEADLAILRLRAPFEPREGFLESLIHAGDLSFPEAEKARILAILAAVPTVVDVYLDRPAVIPEIAIHSAALLANFGAGDAAVLDLIFGRFVPSGKLPFELPSSMEAVRRQKPDVPYDSDNPLFPFGHGLTY
ncbi:MAG TPA: glycoside hydrolase family 3 N-terminal domain-containing protein [Chloroflexota bacterium]|nr:glycoside hydrolase family 3 N-terminal domain-containing protein [Chloroflexota bacterium]